MKEKMEKMEKNKLINNLWKINKYHKIISNKNIQMMRIILILNNNQNNNNRNNNSLK